MNKAFLSRLVQRLLERGPDHPTALGLGEAVAEALKEKATQKDVAEQTSKTHHTRGYKVGDRHG